MVDQRGDLKRVWESFCHDFWIYGILLSWSLTIGRWRLTLVETSFGHAFRGIHQTSAVVSVRGDMSFGTVGIKLYLARKYSTTCITERISSHTSCWLIQCMSKNLDRLIMSVGTRLAPLWPRFACCGVCKRHPELFYIEHRISFIFLYLFVCSSVQYDVPEKS